MIQLTDEEIGAIDIGCGMSEIDGTEPFYSYKYEYHLIKAQLKKVYNWGHEDCPHHAATRHIDKPLNRKFQCAVCWQALLEEIK